MDKSRALSLLVVVINIIVAVKEKEIGIAIFPLLGIPFIWFPGFAKQFSNFVAPGKFGRATPLDPNTPPCLFAAIGWAVMLAPAVFAIASMLANN
jgi:hypothetical protein